MTIFTDMISDSMRWKDFISCTASGLQIRLIVICPDGTEVQSSMVCHVCGHLHASLSPENKEEILAKAKNGPVKVTTESGFQLVALQLKGDAVLIVVGCPSCSESDDQLFNKALISQKLLNSFQGYLYEEIKGGQRAVELSALRQMNHIVLSQFSGNKHALEHSFDLRQLSRVFGTVDSAILITDATGMISYANPGFEKLTGYQVVQLIGQGVNQFPAPWTGFVENKPIHNLEGVMDVIMDTNGRKKYVNWQLSPLLEDGVLFGWLIIINDRTDHYYWQQAVGQAERLSTTSLLVGSLAHEIRNPLSATKGLLQLMGRKRNSDSIRSYIDLSLRELDRITMLINEFLLLGKPVEKTDEPICLATFLQELMPMIQNEGNFYGIEVVLDVKSKPQVQADCGQLAKVVMNLVQNAVQATKNIGPVVVSLSEKDQNAYITLRDHGPGVPQVIQDKLFRPFFTTKERAKGLGLAISQAIVHNHGGDISFWNQPGGGAVFNVILPLYDLKNSSKPVDIVICIKDRIISYPVMQSLQAAGFKVLLAEEDEVFDLINKHKPQICLLEGIVKRRDLVERIKKDNKSITVIILGFVEPDIGNLALQLSLPINYAQLLSKIILSIKR